jgi:ribosomal protein S18 acetylase RimI-like enzyme
VTYPEGEWIVAEKEPAMAQGRIDYRRLDLQQDLTAVVNLMGEVERVDSTGDSVTEETLCEQLTWTGQDPAPNNWVATAANDTLLVGYGMIQKSANDPNADVFVAVHPTWRRRSVGTQLFTYLLARASELEARALRAYVPVSNKASARFVQALGSFEPVSTFTRMTLDLRGPSSASGGAAPSLPGADPGRALPDLPDGFAIRTYDRIEEVEQYTEVLIQSYDGYWGHLHVTRDEVARYLRQLDHSGIFMLFDRDGSIAGTGRAELREPATQGDAPTALIDAPGIVSRYRHADLALPLVLTAIHWLLPKGPELIDLEAWGEAPAVLARYRELGFAVTKEEISYRRRME